MKTIRRKTSTKFYPGSLWTFFWRFFLLAVISLPVISCVPEETPFEITEMSPSNQALNVSVSSTITVQFSYTIDSDSVNATTFKLQLITRYGTAIDVDGSYSFADDLKSVTFTPAKPLEFGTTYQVIFSTGNSGVTSSSRQTLSTSPAWSFKTVAKATDTDNDGLEDQDEVELYNTDPTKSDSDGDGLNDYAEIMAGLDPNDSSDADLDVGTVNDPLYSWQWHLNNDPIRYPGEDINIEPVWAKYAGSPEVVVAVVDSGIEADHKDLKDNLDLSLSWNYEMETNDPTPSGSQISDPGIEYKHGVACAGIVGARGWNNMGVKGVAPFIKLAGLNVFSTGEESDFQDALARNGIDVSSNSWGPGSSWELAEWSDIDFVEQGITNGRNGKGVIYVFAAGNDGFNANASSNVHSSRYTITVSAVNEAGDATLYSNYGANILVAAPGGDSPYIMTTDYSGNILGYGSTKNYADNVDGDYTDDFDGTSASTPMVAGVAALMLQANSDLTWRDVRYILATTARKNDPTDSGWIENTGVTPKYAFNHHYGFGVVDAEAAITSAESFSSLTAEKSLENTTLESAALTDLGTDTFTTTVSDTITIEHIDLQLSLTHSNIGDLEIELESPIGTISKMAFCNNVSGYFYCYTGWTGDSYNNWKFGSERHLDEDSQGTWTMRITDTRSGGTGTLNSWKLLFYGH